MEFCVTCSGRHSSLKNVQFTVNGALSFTQLFFYNKDNLAVMGTTAGSYLFEKCWLSKG